MILELYIENFAIIDKVKVDFTKGFNVLTGETGAGKSIMIDALGLLLGNRSNRDFIRVGTNKALVEGVFEVSNSKEVKEVLNTYGLDIDDGMLIISREISVSGKSTARINGRIVTTAMLKEISEHLIDVHGQHEHQSLLSEEKHINLIDALATKKLKKLKEEYMNAYLKRQKLFEELSEFSYDDMERERKKDLLRFQIEEIEEANIENVEEDELMDEYTRYANSEDIIKTMEQALNIISTDDFDGQSIINMLNACKSIVSSVEHFDSKIAERSKSLQSMIYEIEEIYSDIRIYKDSIDFDMEKLMMLEEKLDSINRLKRKYGQDVEAIIEFKRSMQEELNYIENSEEEVKRINFDIKEIESHMLELCDKMGIERRKVSDEFEESITKELEELNMSKIKFKVDMTKKEGFTLKGNDRVEFLISTNLGEPLRPLGKIVSGGEMSRIMLAFKNILASVDNIETLIFDEIDTGISGRTAQVVGEKIAEISRTHQIICITHLPQIAAMADSHYLIKKYSDDESVKTTIKKLTEDEKVEELSRLLGGVSLTETTKKHAKEMLNMSEKIKQTS